jgi:hypothetical protein
VLLIEKAIYNQTIEFEGKPASHIGVIPGLMHKFIQESEKLILVLFGITIQRDFASNISEHDEDRIGIYFRFALLTNRCE